MSNYDCSGCESCSSGYENKMNGNRGDYSGKDDYASGMPDMKMRNYIKEFNNY